MAGRVASAILCLFLFGVTTPGAFQHAEAAPPAAPVIAVAGNRHTDAAMIRSHFHAETAGIDAAALDAALKSLYATGLFEDVKISRDGDRILVTVIERPAIDKIAFEGNKRIKDDDLKKVVQSRTGGPLSHALVHDDVAQIIELYRQHGYFEVRVDPKTIARKERFDLVFEIKEGDKLAVRQTEFTGNTAYPANKLKGVIKTGETNFLSFLLNNDNYDADQIENDCELLRRFYLARGYADVRVRPAARYEDTKKGVVVSFTIDEGAQYQLGRVDIVSNVKSVDPDTLRSHLRMQSGETYDADAVNKTTEDLAMALAKSGAPFATASPRSERVPEKRTINLVYTVEEGKRLYVERIEIHGNSKTRDDVIRREFEFVEGDAYNRTLVDRGKRRLERLGYFKTVKIGTQPGSAPDRIVVDMTLDEQKTGEFFVSGGYSAADGASATITVGDTNFLGTGDTARASATLGQYVRGFDVSFTDPYALGPRLSLGVDVFGKESLANSYQSYDSTLYGAKILAGTPISDQPRRELELRDLQSGHLARSRARHRVTARAASRRGRPDVGLLRRLQHDLLHARQSQEPDERRAGAVEQRICRPRRRGQIRTDDRGRPLLSPDLWRCRWHRAGAKRLRDALGRAATTAAQWLLRRPATGARFCAQRLWAARRYAGNDPGQCGRQHLLDDLRRAASTRAVGPGGRAIEDGSIFRRGKLMGDQRLERFEACVAVAVAADRQLKRDPRLRRRQPDLGVPVRRAPGGLRLPHRQTILRRHPAAELHRRRI